MFTERRQHPRTRVLRRARIVLRNGHIAIDCIVMDLSEGGARLRVGDLLGVPKAFELRIEHGPVRQVAVCFRNLDQAGVRFTDVLAA